MTVVALSQNGGVGAVRVAVWSRTHRVTKSSAPVPVPSPYPQPQAMADQLTRPHLELAACPGAVPVARHHARQLLWDLGFKELIEPVELVVSELVTNAVQATGGLEPPTHPRQTVPICLWLIVDEAGALVLVWDANSARPQPAHSNPPDCEMGWGLFLVEVLSRGWGWFELLGEPGKVVWAYC